MAKLTRQAQQIFGGQAPSDQLAAFGSMQTGTPVYSTDLSTLQTSDYQQGWQNAVLADKAPFLEEMNGVMYGTTYQLAYLQQMGISEWLNTQTYYTGSRCIASDYNVYKSLTDDNTGNDPVFDGGTNWVLDTPQEASVLTYMTNCLISAPNGLTSYSGNTVTVPELSQFLFPNGRNASNGLQNVNFALASNATGTISGSTSATYVVFVTSDLEVIFANNENYFVTSTQPTALVDSTTQGVWYNPDSNLLYQCAATASTPSWTTFEGAKCATLVYDGSAITSINPVYPIRLLDYNDTEFMAHQGMPSDRYEVLTAAGSASTYTAPADGYYFLSSTSSTASRGWISLVNTSINGFGIKSAVTDGPYTAFCYMPCKKGDIVQIGYSNTGITKFMFIYAQGASND